LEVAREIDKITQKIDEVKRLNSSHLILKNCDLSLAMNHKKISSDSWPKSVKVLHLENCYLQSLPFLPDLELTELSLRNNEIQTLPYHIVMFKHLTILNLGDNRLSVLPMEIGSLYCLQALYLERNNLVSLPIQIGHLNKLLVLSIQHNQLTCLPPSIGDCSSLETLLLDDNRLPTLPHEIGALAKLKFLSILNNGPSMEIPESIQLCTNLKDLIHEKRQIYVVPKKLCIKNNGSAILSYLNNLNRYKIFNFSPNAHWQADSESRTCTNCGTAFSTLNRRHHCRFCGMLFDSKCSNKKYRVLPLGILQVVRVCATCYHTLKITMGTFLPCLETTETN